MSKKIIINKRILEQKYIKNRETVRKIAQQLNLSKNTVYRRLREYDLLLSQSQSAKIRFSLPQNCNGYIDGRSKEKHYCVISGCNNEISYCNWLYGSKKCLFCSMKERRGQNRPEHSIFMLKQNPFKGQRHTLATKKLIGAKSKERLSDPRNHPLYIEGLDRDYPLKFKIIREQIRKRDNHTCQLCNIKQEDCYRALDVHHIDYNKHNLDKTNLITLCSNCHIKTNYNRDYWYAYFMYITECSYIKSS